ncbi:replication initiation protein, partial [Acinetobacter nosocomialis]
NSLIKISAKKYAEMFDISLKNSYSMLRGACKTLFDRQFSYVDWDFDLLSEDTSKIFFTSRWVSKVGYKPGFVYLSFAPDVIPLISRLEKEFTRYDLL